ncbi:MULTISPECIES: hypothetical protein [unclassified Lysobacter]
MDILFAILLYWGVIPSPSVTTTTPAATPTAVADDGSDIVKPRPCGNRCSY